jgi:hypothetical protein
MDMDNDPESGVLLDVGLEAESDLYQYQPSSFEVAHLTKFPVDSKTTPRSQSFSQSHSRSSSSKIIYPPQNNSFIAQAVLPLSDPDAFNSNQNKNIQSTNATTSSTSTSSSSSSSSSSSASASSSSSSSSSHSSYLPSHLYPPNASSSSSSSSQNFKNPKFSIRNESTPSSLNSTLSHDSTDSIDYLRWYILSLASLLMFGVSFPSTSTTVLFKLVLELLCIRRTIIDK